jgi:hypothetical protein
LLAVAALPVAVVATRWSRTYELLDAAVGIPVAMLLGALAVSLARRARTGLRASLGGPQRERPARIGRALGLAGFLLGVTAAMAIGVYAVLANVAD